MSEFKPMLAAKADMSKLIFPIIGQPKYDGIRCCVKYGGLAVSRTLKTIPNLHVQRIIQEMNAIADCSGLDGEIVSYTDGVADSLHLVQSKVMAVDKVFDFKYHVFDDYEAKNVTYEGRYRMLRKRVDRIMSHRNFSLAPYETLFDMDQLNDYEELLVRDNWEGMIGRKPTGFYKYGRATAKEGLLLKFKRFEDAEAFIIGYEELEHNENEAFYDERGQTKRSSHKENKVAGGVLGALLLDWNGIHFKVGTGFDAETRKDIWEKSEEFMGRTVTFKYKGTGPNGKPLIASFKSFRDDLPAKGSKPMDDKQMGLF